ncbi:MAG TPA: ribonuclease HII [Candidatus Saccharimonadales bacterium]|nr:ribonuclease HII [Candidatus Saccharimonadales bacterium]
MIGVDEVGRGSWAGPLLVVAARQTGRLPAGIRDSKLMTRNQRKAIYHLLTANYQFGEGWVSPLEIDKHGLAAALKLAVRRAVGDIGAQKADAIIMDGKVNYMPLKFSNTSCLIGADNLEPAVSAASICAKIKRDDFMINLAARYPRYGFERHVGYGTPEHANALQAYGAIKSVHRLSFAPIAKIAAKA